MRFKNIIIKNFRQYSDIELEFTQKDEYDLQVFIGSNGMGKSNFENAITWCLYGKEYHLDSESKTLPRINTNVLGNTEIGEYSNIIVELTIETDTGVVTFKRSQRFRRNKDLNEYFEESPIFKVITEGEGGTKFHDGEIAKTYVNRYFPEEIQEYFFFDGEQLDDYFRGVQGKKIKNSIFNISQVKLLNNLKCRLQNIENDMEKEISRNNPDIASKEKEKTNLKEQITNHEETIDKLEKQISHADGKIIDLRKQIGSKDNVNKLEEEYDETEIELNSKKKELKVLKNEISSFIFEYYPLLTFFPHFQYVENMIKNKIDNGELPPRIDKNFLKKMLTKSHCDLCDRDLNESGYQNISNMIDKLNVSSKTANVLSSMRSDLTNLIEKSKEYPKVRDQLFNKKRNLVKNIKDLDKKFGRLDKEISSYGNLEDIKEAHEARKNYKTIVEKSIGKKAVFENNLVDLKEELEVVEDKIKEYIQTEKHHNELKKSLLIVKEIISVIQSIESEMMIEVKENMRDNTLENFLQLLWKENTYADIKIDNHYNIELIHKDGYSCLGSCSAAERALLAMSYTLALHSVSGFESIFLIDTPISRVSDVNRRNFANVLKKVSKRKQVIILFTPSEYSKEIEEVFLNDVSILKLVTNNEEITYLEKGN